MLSESVASAIFQASITGAGLVLALYALILPIFPKLYGLQKIERKEVISKAQKLTEKYSPESTDEELGEIIATFRDVPARKVPYHMGIGIGITYAGFILSSAMAFCWICNYKHDIIETTLFFIFFCTIIIFGFIGILVIKDIYKIMKAEYESQPGSSIPSNGGDS